MTTDPDLRSGVAVEFPLDEDGPDVDVAACLDRLRSAPPALLSAETDVSLRQDRHGNHIIAATDAGWTSQCGGALWFEDVYTLTGYLLTGDGRHRLYVHDRAVGDVLGIDLPLAASGSQITPGFAGSLPQELASVIESGQAIRICRAEGGGVRIDRDAP